MKLQLPEIFLIVPRDNINIKRIRAQSIKHKSQLSFLSITYECATFSSILLPTLDYCLYVNKEILILLLTCQKLEDNNDNSICSNSAQHLSEETKKFQDTLRKSIYSCAFFSYFIQILG